MILLYDVELAPVERQDLLQYLSTNHGLAPGEAKTVAYDVERRIHEDTGIPNTTIRACGGCHNFARVLSWRRSVDDWKELLRSHAIRYNAVASEEVSTLLTKIAPLHTPEWEAWKSRPAQNPGGRWLVTASILGRIKYVGEMEMDVSGGAGEFNTRTTLRSVTDGSTITREGRGTSDNRRAPVPCEREQNRADVDHPCVNLSPGIGPLSFQCGNQENNCGTQAGNGSKHMQTSPT